MKDRLFNLMISRTAKVVPEYWEPLPPVDAQIACITCGAGRDKSAEDFLVAVGFGNACVTASGKHIIDEQEWIDTNEFGGEEVTLSLVERVAKTKPDADWRIHMFGPLSGQTYQRQAEGEWVLIERNEGFA